MAYKLDPQNIMDFHSWKFTRSCLPLLVWLAILVGSSVWEVCEWTSAPRTAVCWS